MDQSSFTYPLDEVQWGSATTGAYTDVLPGMTVLFGTNSGMSDRGISRVRKIPDSDTLFIGRSSQGSRYGEVDLADGTYISILSDYRVWAKIPFIDEDGNIFQDSDLDWATWGQYSPPVANAGAPVVATIDSVTEVITASFSAAASFATHPGATLSSYLWTVGDGTITVGTSADEEITATFPAGFRHVTLAVTDSNDQTHYAHVPVLAMDPDDDPTVPNFTIERHTIRPDGQEMTVRVRSNIHASFYLDNTMAFVVDGEPASASDRSNIVFYGWAEEEPTEIDATPTGLLRDVVLTLIDVAGRLRILPGFPQVLEHVSSPAKWGDMDSPNIDRMLHFLLQWQSTALDLVDFTWSGTTTSYPFRQLESIGQSLWEQAAKLAQALIPTYALTCNRLGQLRTIVDPLLIDSGSRTSTVQASLDTDAYTNLRYTRQRHPRYHWLRSNAIVSGTSTPIGTVFAIAPGTSPGQGENDYADNYNLAVDQTALNTHAGHLYARLNATEGHYSVTLVTGDSLGIDPADMTWVTLSIANEVAAQRGLAFTDARFLCHQIDIRYAASRTGLVKTVALTLERETVGTAAVTETVEEAEPADDGDYNIPDTETPFNNGLPAGQDVVGVIGRNGYIWTCSDFTSAGTPTWSRNTTAAAAAAFSGDVLRTFVIDPFSPGYRGTGSEIRGFAVSGTKVYRVNDLFGTPSYTELHTLTTAASGVQEWTQIACSFGRYEADEADNPWIMVAYSAASGSNPLRTYVTYSRDAGATWSSEIDVSGFTRTAVIQEISRPAIYLSPRTPGLAYVGAWTSTGTNPDGDLYKTTDWGATWALATEVGGDTGDSIGLAMHVPWEDNADEGIVYFGKFDRTSSIFNYWLWRSVAGSASDISPVDSGKKYGPARGLFSIRALDTDRQEMILAGVYDNTDNEYITSSSSAAVSAVWRTSDGGDTWTCKTSDAATTNTSDCVLQVAFSADDENIWYGWGGGGYLIYTEDDGANITDKSPTSTIAYAGEFMGIFGGGS